MPRSVLIALVLTASVWSTATCAQTSGDTFGEVGTGSTPRLVFPGELTSPMTSGLGPEDTGPSKPAPGEWGYESPGEAWEVPYSVEGEETLEPGTN